MSRPAAGTAAQPAETHRVSIRLDVDIAVDLVASIAEKRGVPVATVLAEIASDCECRTYDAVRWRHGVERVGVTSK